MVDDIAAMTDYESESVDIQTPGGDIVYVDQAVSFSNEAGVSSAHGYSPRLYQCPILL